MNINQILYIKTITIFLFFNLLWIQFTYCNISTVVLSACSGVDLFTTPRGGTVILDG